MNRSKRTHPRRWFQYSLIGLFLFLCIGIVLSAALLLRRGTLPKTGIITGSSMEPILRGPRFLWTCDKCLQSHAFALDTCKSNQPFRCCTCNELDSKSTFDFGDLDSISQRLEPGIQVRFETLRSVRASRKLDIAKGLTHTSGLRRGDLVVLQESPGMRREIKRVVGFSHERIDIDQGDLFVDELRWSKSLEQSLRQSILLNAWDGAQGASRVGGPVNCGGLWSNAGKEFTGSIEGELTFDYESPQYMDNRIAVNAHDSHAIVSVHDFGFAFQLSGLESDWKFRCRFSSEISQPTIELELKGSDLTIQSGDQVANVTLDQGADKSIWIVLAMIDGYLAAGNQNEEWLRRTLPAAETEINRLKESSKQSPRAAPRGAPITIETISGKLSVDQLLVFRDILYRGNGDSVGQTWEPDDRVIVLGDNVSASSDSRDRWPEGLLPNAIKGVVLQTDSAMETLLRQR